MSNQTFDSERSITELTKAIKTNQSWLQVEDVVDLYKILNLIKQGNYKTAGELMEDLDTVVREIIPDYTYSLCEEFY